MIYTPGDLRVPWDRPGSGRRVLRGEGLDRVHVGEDQSCLHEAEAQRGLVAVGGLDYSR